MRLIAVISTVLLCAAHPTPAQAAKEALPKPIDFMVRFDQTMYSVTLDKKSLTYTTAGFKLFAPAKMCAKAALDRTVVAYRKLRSITQPSKSTDRSFDVSVIEKGKEPIYVARGSEFGTWLRELPNRAPYDLSEATSKCR